MLHRGATQLLEAALLRGCDEGADAVRTVGLRGLSLVDLATVLSLPLLFLSSFS